MAKTDSKLPAIPEERRDSAGLTPRMRLGAYFEAQGMNREDVAAATNVSVTSVSRWRREDAYNKEIARWASVEIEKFELLVGRVRFEAIEATIRAIRSALSELDAEDEHGRPDYKARREARAQLFEFGNQMLELIKQPGGEHQGAAQAAAAVTIVLKNEEPEVIEYTGEVKES